MPLWFRAEDTLRYSVKNLPSSELAHTLLDPDIPRVMQDIKSITVEMSTNSLVLVGPTDVLLKTEQLLRMLDQKPREVKLEFRLEKDGKEVWKGEIAKAKNNKAAYWSRGNFQLIFTPHVNGDGSLSLVVETNSQKRYARINSAKPFPLSFDEGTLTVVSPSTELFSPFSRSRNS
ncbi:MAG: hypothetical protein QM758_16710 [Armatimonas sp.]